MAYMDLEVDSSPRSQLGFLVWICHYKDVLTDLLAGADAARKASQFWPP